MMATQTESTSIQGDRSESTNATNRELHSAFVKQGDKHTRSQQVRENIDNIKFKFIDLLKLYGIVDEDVPVLEKPISPYYSHQQPVVNILETMSKTSQQTAESQHSEHEGCDTPSYKHPHDKQTLLVQINPTANADKSQPTEGVITPADDSTMNSDVQSNTEGISTFQKHLACLSPAQEPCISQAPGFIFHCNISQDTVDNQWNKEATYDADVGLNHTYVISGPSVDKMIHGHSTDSTLARQNTPPPCVISSSSSMQHTVSGQITLGSLSLGSTPGLQISDSPLSADIPFSSLLDLTDCQDLLEDLSKYLPTENTDESDSERDSGPLKKLKMDTELNFKYQTTKELSLKPENPPEPDLLSESTKSLMPAVPPGSESAKSLMPAVPPGSELSAVTSEPKVPSLAFAIHAQHSANDNLERVHEEEKQAQCDASAEPSVINEDLPPRNVSWSYHELPDAPLKALAFQPAKKHQQINENSFITVRPQRGVRSSAGNREASKLGRGTPVNICLSAQANCKGRRTSRHRSVTGRKLGKLLLQSVHEGKMLLSSDPVTPPLSSSESNFLHSEAVDAAQHASQSKEKEHSASVCKDYSPSGNNSWSYYDLPNVPHDPHVSLSSGKNHVMGNKNNDRFVSVRPKQPLKSPEDSHDAGSASKRRKVKDRLSLHNSSRNGAKRLKSTISVPSRQIKYTKRDSDFTFLQAQSCKSEGQKTHERPNRSTGLRKMMHTENKNPSSLNYKSHRKPFGELHGNARLLSTRDSIDLTLKRNFKFGKKPLGMYQFNYQQELYDGDHYKCNLTSNIQEKSEDFIARSTYSLSSDEHSEDLYAFKDPTTHEVLVRKVEGAESSLDVTLKTSNGQRTPREVDQRLPRSKVLVSNKQSVMSSDNRAMAARSSNNRVHSSKFSHRNLSTSSVFLSASKSHNPSGTVSSMKSSPFFKSHTTHPVASSTLIMDASSASTGAESLYEWSDDDESLFVDRESPKYAEENMKNIKTKMSRWGSHNKIRSDTCFDSGYGLENKENFSLSAPVNRSECSTTMQVSNRTASEEHILAAAVSLLKNIKTASSDAVFQFSDLSSGQLSYFCSRKDITSLTLSKWTETSIVFASNEENAVENWPLSDGPLYTKHISKKDPHSKERIYSVLPGITEAVQKKLMHEDNPDISGTNTSGNSPCPAARCRPRIVKKSLFPVESSTKPGQALIANTQDVNSIDVFCIKNSCNSSTDITGSKNINDCPGKSKGISLDLDTENGDLSRSSHPSLDTSRTKSIAGKNISPSKYETVADNENDKKQFSRPLTPVNSNIQKLPSKSEDVTFSSNSATAHWLLSVQNNHPDRKSSCMVTSANKTKNKNSLLQKFRHFGRNLYKKSGKFHFLRL